MLYFFQYEFEKESKGKKNYDQVLPNKGNEFRSGHWGCIVFNQQKS